MKWPDLWLPPINLYTVPKMIATNPNDCASCGHIMTGRVDWHCAMFYNEPTGPCHKHTALEPISLLEIDRAKTVEPAPVIVEQVIDEIAQSALDSANPETPTPTPEI